MDVDDAEERTDLALLFRERYVESELRVHAGHTGAGKGLPRETGVFKAFVLVEQVLV